MYGHRIDRDSGQSGISIVEIRHIVGSIGKESQAKLLLVLHEKVANPSNEIMIVK